MPSTSTSLGSATTRTLYEADSVAAGTVVGPVVDFTDFEGTVLVLESVGPVGGRLSNLRLVDSADNESFTASAARGGRHASRPVFRSMSRMTCGARRLGGSARSA